MWKAILDTLVNKEISVLLNAEGNPLMMAMKGTLQPTSASGIWALDCKPGRNAEGGLTPSGMLYFSEDDLVRIYDTREASPLSS